MRRRTALTLAAGTATALAVPGSALGIQASKVHEGEIGGARFRVEIPGNWNGILLLWSRPPIYTAQPGEPVQVASDPFTQQWLSRNGYAVAASNYHTPSSAAFDEALADQLSLLDWIDTNIGQPQHTIAWGNSGGGLMSVLLAERHPDRIAGAVPLCGVLAGLDGVLNLTLDYSFTLTTLLEVDIPIVDITDPAGTKAQAERLIMTALSTSAGRARLALASTMANVPGWSRALQPRPTSVLGEITAQGAYGQMGLSTFWGPLRADLERRAGGNPSSNVGVDYARRLALSSQRELVHDAYWDGSVDLEDDLSRLDSATRVSADSDAACWLGRLTPTGGLVAPVLSVHSIGDGLAPPEHESAYASRVRKMGRQHQLRQVYTDRGGHGCFTASEAIVALQALVRRVVDGRWPQLNPGHLNTAARALGPGYQLASDWGGSFEYVAAAPAFCLHTPKRFRGL